MQEIVKIIWEAVGILTGPLAKESHRNDHHHSVPSSLGVVQLAEIPPGVIVTCNGEVLGDLAQLKLDKRVVLVAVAVVLGHNRDSLLTPILGEQPSSEC